MLPVMVALGLTIQQSVAAPPPELRREELMSALGRGGYTILVRHSRTDRSIPNGETPGYTPPLRADQRNLTADGERDVRLMAEVVRKFSLPIGEVLSSPVYRCRETADAFGPAALTMTLRTWPTTAETQALVSAMPRAGTNRVLVTHHFVIENHVPGIRPGDIGESEAAVVLPDGNGAVRLVGRITLDDWTSLAGQVTADAHQAHAVPAGHATTMPVMMQPIAGVMSTRAGRMAARYIEAFNTGDSARMRAFIEAALVARTDRPTDARVQNYQRLFQQHGPLATGELGSASGDTVTIVARSLAGEIFIQVVADAAPSGRIASVAFGSRSGRHP